jgi:putative ABC transport system permease protein
MIAVAIKGLGTRKARAVLTALAIVLGVAMVSGTLVLTDTISKSFDNLFTESYQGTSAVISARDPGVKRGGANTPKPPIAASLLEKVRRLPGVLAAAGSIQDFATVVGKTGKALQSIGAPTYLFGYDFSQPRFVPIELASGRLPSGPGEIAIDKHTASSKGFHVDDPIRVVTHGPARRFRISGIARYKTVSSIGGAIFVVTDLRTAQALYGKTGKVDSISVAARSGVSTDQVIREVKRILPPSAVVRSAAAQAKKTQEDEGTKSLTNLLRYFLLAFGAIALFVGAFVIFNTLSITVAQRTRELATLRTIGATPRQVLGSVVLEALVLGAVASVIGLFAGLGLAQGLKALLSGLGIDLPSTTTVFSFRTVIVALVVGLLITLLAGLAPAIRATRVPPIMAVREGATLPRSRLSALAPYVAGVATGIAVVVLVAALALKDLTIVQQLLLIVVGCVLLFAGVALVSSRFVGLLALVVGWPASRLGGAPGGLARHNSRRNPGRVAVTAAALTVGIALVTFVAVLGAAIQESNKTAIDRQLNADYVVSSGGRGAFQSAAAAAVQRAPDIAVASSVRSDSANVAGSGSTKAITGIDPRTIAATYRFDWTDGSDAALRQLGSSGAIVSEDCAKAQNLKRGERFGMRTPSNRAIELRVVGIYRARPLAPLLGDVTISQAAYDRAFDRTKTQYTFLRVRGGTGSSTEAALDRVLRPFPDAKLKTKSGFIDEQGTQLAVLLNLVFLLLALAIVVSLFGIVNTLALSVFERTRELGMLRAVGMIRRQVRWMVLHESVIIALIGGLTGTAVGVFLGALVSSALGKYDLQFQLPVGYLAVFLLVAFVAGLVAAILPARRASRLDVLEALQYE